MLLAIIGLINMNYDISTWVLREGEFVDFTEIEDFVNCFMAVVCVVCAGLASGLTMGLLSLDETKLEIISITGKIEEQAAVAKVLPIIKQHHLLLVTLLLFNSLANETLPIFLGAIMPNYVAVIVSVTFILLFGEIIPSALFTGPQQLITAAKMTTLVSCLMTMLWPIAYPIGKVLDHFFGAEESTGAITREELEALVRLQSSEYRRDNSVGELSAIFGLEQGLPFKSYDSISEDIQQPLHSVGSLSNYEVNVLTGMLKLSKLRVGDIMIPIKSVFMLSNSLRLDRDTMESILRNGFSRIPIYKKHDRQNLIGYLLVKELVVISPDDGILLDSIPLRMPLFIRSDVSLLEMLSVFQTSRSHVAFVTDHPSSSHQRTKLKQRTFGSNAIKGIVTMEDVIEKIIQANIEDETDHRKFRGMESRGQLRPSSTVLARSSKPKGGSNGLNPRKGLDSVERKAADEGRRSSFERLIPNHRQVECEEKDELEWDGNMADDDEMLELDGLLGLPKPLSWSHITKINDGLVKTLLDDTGASDRKEGWNDSG